VGTAGPPSWSPPEPAAPAATSVLRRPVFLMSAGMLAIGLAVGAVGTVFIVRGTVDSGHTATMLVDDTPAKQGGAGNAVSVAQQLGPAVGTIIAKEASGDALGSGFVIGHDGSVSYLLTNNHVVAGATDLHVVMPGGRNLKATVVGTDSFDDLAVISVPDANLPVATFGASSKLQVGQAVVAIGSPLGNEGSVTSGVISALHRTITAGSDVGGQTENLQDVLQTDASINRGNSGGPLADTDGRVVGVNVAIAGNSNNIGYSIPSDLAQQVARSLIAHDKVQHPFLGVSYLTGIEAVEAGQGFDGPGVLVQSVSAGSPAAKAGFQKGDILQAVAGAAIDNGDTLGGLIQLHKVGDTVDFTVKRGGNVIHLSATLTDRPTSG
jgi:putative serine protease PepD